MLELTTDNFEETLTNHDSPILVDFWGPSCTRCKSIQPHIETLAQTYDQMVFSSVDISKQRRLALSQKVRSLPAIIIYKSGEKVAFLSGEEVSPDAIETAINNSLQ